MKTSAQLRQMISEKTAKAVAMAELAKSENRDLTAEEKADIDKMIGDNGDVHQLQADLNRAIRLEKTTQDMLNGRIDQNIVNPGNKPLIGDAMDDGYPVFAMERVKVPARAKQPRRSFSIRTKMLTFPVCTSPQSLTRERAKTLHVKKLKIWAFAFWT